MARVVHDEPLWLEQEGRLAVLHADGLGSIVLATDAAQAVVERTTYTAFGVPVRKGSAGVQPFAFTGREWDVELGLYYYRARYYDPKVGRFLSRDPLGLAASPNPYTYVENNPTNAIDPRGANPVARNLCWEAVRLGLGPWGEKCFLEHYLHGGGRPVDLIEVGLLEALRAAKDTKTRLQATREQLQQIGLLKAKELCQGCDKSTKQYTFGTDPDKRERNFTSEPGLFVLGKGPMTVSSSCLGIVSCATRTCSFDCNIYFDVVDKIGDLFDMRELGLGERDFGTPYWVNARWTEQWSGGGGF